MRSSASYLLAFLLFLSFSLFVAGQQSKPRTTDPSGFGTTEAHDPSGRVIAVTDNKGNTTHPGQSFANITGSSGEANSQAPTASISAITAAITIHVPADQPTIQAAIDAANNGDTVLVSSGTYKENIDFHGKAITLVSQNGPAATIIDGQNPEYCGNFRHFGRTSVAAERLRDSEWLGFVRRRN